MKLDGVRRGLTVLAGCLDESRLGPHGYDATSCVETVLKRWLESGQLISVPDVLRPRVRFTTEFQVFVAGELRRGLTEGADATAKLAAEILMSCNEAAAHAVVLSLRHAKPQPILLELACRFPSLAAALDQEDSDDGIREFMLFHRRLHDRLMPIIKEDSRRSSTLVITPATVRTIQKYRERVRPELEGVAAEIASMTWQGIDPNRLSQMIGKHTYLLPYVQRRYAADRVWMGHILQKVATARGNAKDGFRLFA